MRHFAIERAQVGIEPVNPMTADLVLRGLINQMMADKFNLGLRIPNAHHPQGQSGDVGAQLAVLQTASLAPQAHRQDRVGWNRYPFANRRILRHEHQRHQKIVVILIELTAGKADLYAVLAQQERVFDINSILTLHTRK